MTLASESNSVSATWKTASRGRRGPSLRERSRLCLSLDEADPRLLQISPYRSTCASLWPWLGLLVAPRGPHMPGCHRATSEHTKIRIILKRVPVIIAKRAACLFVLSLEGRRQEKE